MKWRVLQRYVWPLRSTLAHPQWLFYRQERYLRQWLHMHARGSVLDVGCAGGAAAAQLAPECAYVGVDFPATANDLYATRPQIFADGAWLPFTDDSFDTVLLLEVLEHVTEPERVLSEAARVLKPGGRMLFSMPFLYPVHDAPHDYRRYTEYGLRHAFERAGLLVERMEPRQRGLEAVGLLANFALCEEVMDALRQRHWRLLLAPLLLSAIPVINLLAWMFAGLGGSWRLACGHRVIACKASGA